MLLSGQTGVQNNQDGSGGPGGNPVRMGKQGDLIASELHGRYYEQTYRQNMFSIQGTAVTTTAGGAATFTGLAVGNPVGSGVNLVVNKVTVNQVAAFTAATTFGVMYGPMGANPITASLNTINNHFVNGKASSAVATAGQTITSPTNWILIGSSGSGAMTVPLFIPPLIVDLEGSLIIPPGSFFASYTSAITTTAALFYFQWEEVPV